MGWHIGTTITIRWTLVKPTGPAPSKNTHWDAVIIELLLWLWHVQTPTKR